MPNSLQHDVQISITSFEDLYHSQQTNTLQLMAIRKIIQSLQDMIIIFSAYALEFKDSSGFTNDLCTLIAALKLAYKTSIHYLTGKAARMLEKRWNLRLHYDTLKKDLVDIHQKARSFKISLTKKDIRKTDV
ncbi:hypothetical protein O181_080548 [Austropuccinia psidii MF-1]|uniref:Uncharacterized protein n=1 Tax=Austropuccinia psidii MF-1 TaxID=1389203 RepID=A0A9Q3IGM3_9BASI|nr:hypothetical protein [Austropuccinia psidii MF-1]